MLLQLFSIRFIYRTHIHGKTARTITDATLSAQYRRIVDKNWHAAAPKKGADRLPGLGAGMHAIKEHHSKHGDG
jgi:hypothetical protein